MVKSKLVVAVVFILLASVVFGAQLITTPVRFILPTTTTFTLAIPGNNATTFASTTAGVTATTIMYNSTSRTDAGLNATAVGGAQQTPAIPIFNITNTGNININITINFSTALPTGVEVKGGWGTNAYQTGSNGCTGPAAGPPVNATNGDDKLRCSNITASQVLTTIANLSTSGAAAHRNIWMWADYNNVVAGTDSVVNLVFTSLNTTG